MLSHILLKAYSTVQWDNLQWLWHFASHKNSKWVPWLRVKNDIWQQFTFAQIPSHQQWSCWWPRVEYPYSSSLQSNSPMFTFCYCRWCDYECEWQQGARSANSIFESEKKIFSMFISPLTTELTSSHKSKRKKSKKQSTYGKKELSFMIKRKSMFTVAFPLSSLIDFDLIRQSVTWSWCFSSITPQCNWPTLKTDMKIICIITVLIQVDYDAGKELEK